MLWSGGRRRCVGLPIFCTETIFEALITLIIEQHITWKNALRYQRTLMQNCSIGAQVRWTGRLSIVFLHRGN